MLWRLPKVLKFTLLGDEQANKIVDSESSSIICSDEYSRAYTLDRRILYLGSRQDQRHKSRQHRVSFCEILVKFLRESPSVCGWYLCPYLGVKLRKAGYMKGKGLDGQTQMKTCIWQRLYLIHPCSLSFSFLDFYI